MVFFELVFDAVLNIISSLGYGGVLILMAMESMVFPVPSEAVMPFAGYLAATGEMNFALVIIASTIGSIVGSLISYYMGFNSSKSTARKQYSWQGSYQSCGTLYQFQQD